MAFTIALTGEAPDVIRRLRAFDRRRLADEITRQLTHEPTVQTRNRKCMDGLSPSFEHIPPVWELRVGDFRIFYDVNTDEEKVYIRAIRKKNKGETTEDII